jgi:tartronate-semialdehyde synthase
VGGRLLPTQADAAPQTHFDEVPIKSQRVYEEMNRVFGRETRYVTAIGLSQIAGGQFLHVFEPRN